MKVQRLITTLSASIDRFVGSIENHEAVADALLKRLADAAARVRLEQASNQERQKRLRAALADNANAIERWQARAVNVSSEDPDTALACVERLERAEERRSRLEEKLATAEQFAEELAHSLTEIEAHLDAARSQAEQLKARSACSDARDAVNSFCIDGAMSALLERWERAVLCDEYRQCATVTSARDEFASRFDREERSAARSARLAALVAERGAKQ